MGKFAEQIAIKASRPTVWQALADIGAIYQWNPGVLRSRTTTAGEIGLGSGRRCELGHKNYLDERVVEWEPDRALTMRIVDTNLPFKTADIRFTLTARDDDTLVTVSPSYTLKYGVLGRIMDAMLLRYAYRRGMINLLTGLKRYIEDGHRNAGMNLRSGTQ